MTKEELRLLLASINTFIREEEKAYVNALRKRVNGTELKQIKTSIKSLRTVRQKITEKLDDLE